MTRREWLLKNHPDCVSVRHGGTAEGLLEGGCIGCPYNYPDMPGAEDLCDPEQDCEVCWTRELPGPGKGAGNKLETALRAVNIAARVMTAAGMCLYENCTEDGRLAGTCDKCIEEWLLDKAETELRNARNAEIISDMKDID